MKVTTNGQVTQFAYDGNGDMVKMTLPNGAYTLYYFGMYEVRSDGDTTQYYPASLGDPCL